MKEDPTILVGVNCKIESRVNTLILYLRQPSYVAKT